MEVKPGYKQTEVGVIPEDWEVKTFGQISRVNQGLQIAIERRLKFPTPTSKTYITIQFLNDGKSVEYIDDYPLSACCVKDDVLMTRTGNTGIVVSGVEGVFHNNFFKINFDRKKLNRDFLIGFLSLSSTQKIILNKAGTSTIPDLNHGDFYSVFLPVPPLPEQRAIAEALSDVDALLLGLDRLIAKKRDLKQAAMQQLLTGKTRLPGFHGEWEVTTFGSVVRHHAGNSTLIKGKLLSSPASGLYAGFSASGQDVWCDRFEHEGDAVVVSAVGSRCGKAFAASGKWCAIANTHVVWPNASKIDRRFLNFFINDEDFWLKSGSGQPFVLFKQTFARPLCLPPLSEQVAIAEVLTDMDAEIAALEQRREKTRALKQGMMQELLTGRTRLV